MIDLLAETTVAHTALPLSLVGLAGIFTLLFSLWFPKLMRLLMKRLLSLEALEVYQKITAPYQNWLRLVVFLILSDIIILIVSANIWLKLFEIPLGISVGIILIWLFSRLFQEFFDIYLLDIALSSRKLNTELLIVAKFLANSIIILMVVLIFAQTHEINVVGLIASLGVGGLAIAFAAQKTLEQLLGGIVLYLDRPFVVGDYIHLPDRTFGQVESIGLRSTKIRTSGKGTLTIVPNSSLTQVNIENFTGAKKVISLLYITFYRAISQQEKALIRQLIFESTGDIFGINSRQTEVVFKVFTNEEEREITQAQTTLFILGAGEVSMELRRQLLDIARDKLAAKLKAHGIDFDIEEPNIYVDSPITI